MHAPVAPGIMSPGDPMDDGPSAERNRPRPPWRAGLYDAARRRSMLPHHRRRRALALLCVVAAGVLGAFALGAGAGARHLVVRDSAGSLARIRTPPGEEATSPRPTAMQRAAESRAIDRALAYTPYVRVAGRQHREIALTFDDGPGPYTPQILSILQAKNVPATFFEVSLLERYFHASTSRIVADGYAIGDHTMDHAPMALLSRAGQRAQLLGQMAVIRRYGAPFPRLFRPPYGSWNRVTLALLHRYRMLMVLWTVDTSDYRRPGVRAIVHSAVSGARPGAIILLHDAGGDRTQTVRALPRIISALRARGYRFVTVPRLLLDNPPPRNQRISAVIGTGGRRRVARRFRTRRHHRPARRGAVRRTHRRTDARATWHHPSGPAAGGRTSLPTHVRDAVPARLGRQLDRLPTAVRLDVHERIRVSVEVHVELSFLDTLIEPGAAEDEPAQPVHERALGRPDELGPAVVDVLAQR
jgi:peptidoglycan/xylan/chitin deacetylase (PgdA/CDA1 family)